jgi:hypothetical protein
MNKLRFTTILGSLAATGFVYAIEVGEKPKTPQLPGVPYVVHDGTRPQPVKVESGGAVSVKPPGDAIVLIGEKCSDTWNGNNWPIEGGVMTVARGGGVSSKATFGDCQLHLEYRVPKGRKVNGQAGGNSGVFLMGLYEVQVGESHTNQTYPDGQTAALYGQAPPRVNPSTPQGEWQSFDIIFEAPKYEGGKVSQPAVITVIHNGVMVHHRKALLGPTTHKALAKYPAKHPEKAPISLQDHGDPIQYRNIWVREFGAYDAAAKK